MITRAAPRSWAFCATSRALSSKSLMRFDAAEQRRDSPGMSRTRSLSGLVTVGLKVGENVGGDGLFVGMLVGENVGAVVPQVTCMLMYSPPLTVMYPVVGGHDDEDWTAMDPSKVE